MQYFYTWGHVGFENNLSKLYVPSVAQTNKKTFFFALSDCPLLMSNEKKVLIVFFGEMDE